MATRAYGSQRTVENVEYGPTIPDSPAAEPVDLTDPDRPAADPAEPTGDPTAQTGPIDPGEAQRKAAAAKERKRAKLREYQRKYKERNAKGKDEPGTAAASRKAATQATLDLNHILYSLHAMGALLLKAPALVITEEESKRLAAAITRVTELYEIPMLDEKSRAWINLGLVGVEVYGTRVTAAIVERKRKPAPAIVRPFERPQHPPGPGPIPASPMDASASWYSEGVNGSA